MKPFTAWGHLEGKILIGKPMRLYGMRENALEERSEFAQWDHFNLVWRKPDAWERLLERWSCERQNVMNGAGRVRFFIVDSDLADMSIEGIEQGRWERWRKHIEQENSYCGSQHDMTDGFGELLWGLRVRYSGSETFKVIYRKRIGLSACTKVLEEHPCSWELSHHASEFLRWTGEDECVAIHPKDRLTTLG